MRTMESMQEEDGERKDLFGMDIILSEKAWIMYSHQIDESSIKEAARLLQASI